MFLKRQPTCFLGIVLWETIGAIFLFYPSSGESPPLLANQDDTPQKVPLSPLGGRQKTPQTWDGQQLLAQAIVTLESRTTITGKIHYYFEMFNDVSVEGTGTYLAQLSQTGQWFRWELFLPQQGERPYGWELFDGQALWIYQNDPKEQKETLRRVDILQVAQHLEKQGNLPKMGEIGNWPGLGGLSRLLRSLQANFQFTVVENTTLRITDGQTSQRLPVWKLLGVWKSDRLAQLLPDQADRIQPGLPVQGENLPGQIPDHVLLLLGQEDLFPYEIQYRRRSTGRLAEWLAQFAWLQRQDRTLARIEFVEVVLNNPLPPDAFHYQPPPHLTPSNATQEFIANLQKQMKQ
jgi:hypothetical protein